MCLTDFVEYLKSALRSNEVRTDPFHRFCTFGSQLGNDPSYLGLLNKRLANVRVIQELKNLFDGHPSREVVYLYRIFNGGYLFRSTVYIHYISLKDYPVADKFEQNSIQYQKYLFSSVNPDLHNAGWRKIGSVSIHRQIPIIVNLDGRCALQSECEDRIEYSTLSEALSQLTLHLGAAINSDGPSGEELIKRAHTIESGLLHFLRRNA